MSSISNRGQSIGIGYKSRRDFTDTNNLFSIDSNRMPHAEPQDMDNSKLDFLDKQTFVKEESYKFWLVLCNIVNLFLMICTILIVIVWFHWLSKLNKDEMKCVDLKNYIIWVVVVYIVGIFSQIIGVVAGYTKSAIGYFTFEIVLIVLFILRLNLDIPTINYALQYLQGCTETKASIDLAYYVFGTIFYCIMIMVLFTCNLNMLISLGKVKKAQRVRQDYFIRNEKYASSHV